jgi:hypothetical protein
MNERRRCRHVHPCGRVAAGIAGVALAAAAWAAAACKDSTGPGTVRGQLAVELSSTGPTGAAFLVTITGDSIANPVAAQSGHKIYPYISGRTAKVAVVGSLSSGTLLRFTVPDVNRADAYRATLAEVAGSDNALLPTSAFTVTVVR